MRTTLFDYHLPSELIAQRSVRPRDASRLLVLERRTGAMEHRVFRDVLEYLRPGDLLVLNNTKVFRARLFSVIGGSRIEIFLLHPLRAHFHAIKHESRWMALARPGKKLSVGSVVRLVNGLSGVVKRKNSDGTVEVLFNRESNVVVRIANKIGKIPVPPYIKHEPRTLADYQTVYARKTGSVAAPTAGFHFTPALIKRIRAHGVKIAFITLHVGLGTFQPIRSIRLEDHLMHAEWAEISPKTIAAISAVKKSGGRVIAVGTTTVRTLEGLLTSANSPELADKKKIGNARSGWVNLFIQPGFTFRIVDALITNFHLPRSTLLALVSAFAGRARVMRTYRAAVRKKYRFYSFGDAMFIH